MAFTDIERYARRLAGAITPTSPLTGLYVHGSAALGGFNPAVSDVDVLAVVPESLGPAAQQRLGADLLAASEPCPGTQLEMSVITATVAARLGDCRYEVHLGDGMVYPGAGAGGDPDLILHVEVCRRSGHKVIGPEPARVFGTVPPDRVAAAIRDELAWGADHASSAYAVLNACRALCWARTGEMVSKVEAGEWYIGLNLPHPVVIEALDAQRGALASPPASMDPRVAEFVTTVLGCLQIRPISG